MSARIVIADDEGLVRDGLRMLLDLEDDLEVVAVCEDGEQAIERVRCESPDVVLMDIRMPGVDGVEATRRIRKGGSEVPILILTTFNDDDYIRQALSAGASGYILKNRPSEQIVESVRSVLRGVSAFDSQVLRQLSEMVSGGRPRSEDELGVSHREYEVLSLVADGLSNKEIAAKLSISEGTVRNHVSQLLEKLGARDRTQLALAFHRCRE